MHSCNHLFCLLKQIIETEAGLLATLAKMFHVKHLHMVILILNISLFISHNYQYILATVCSV